MNSFRQTECLLIACIAVFVIAVPLRSAEPHDTIRVATYNTSLFRDADGRPVRDLENGDNEQAKHIAKVIQRARPNVMLINEFDYDAEDRAATLLLEKYLAVGQSDCEPIRFAYHYTGPVNTGTPSGMDLNKDGKKDGPNDAYGFGRHEGQYGMLVLSQFPIEAERVRSFQKFLWKDMPDAMRPVDPKTNEPYYGDAEMAILRLSSKSFWDVPIKVTMPDSQATWTLHLLPSHPTPPVFDGPEDRNGKRNHDEIRLLADYIEPARGSYLVDDQGTKGGLKERQQFIIVGDLNCDPVDGQGVPGTMDQLLKHPRVNSSFIPASSGGKLATE